MFIKGLFCRLSRVIVWWRREVSTTVIDPVKVVRMALQNAASVASLMITPSARWSSGRRRRKAGGAGSHAGHGRGDF